MLQFRVLDAAVLYHARSVEHHDGGLARNTGLFLGPPVKRWARSSHPGDSHIPGPVFLFDLVGVVREVDAVRLDAVRTIHDFKSWRSEAHVLVLQRHHVQELLGLADGGGSNLILQAH